MSSQAGALLRPIGAIFSRLTGGRPRLIYVYPKFRLARKIGLAKTSKTIACKFLLDTGPLNESIWCYRAESFTYHLKSPSARVKVRTDVMKDAKRINGFEGYCVDADGHIYSLNYKRTGCVKKLKQKRDKDGYLLVNLFNNGKICTKKSHRLVAEAFILNSKNLPEVNHKNGNKADNRVSNLEWVTRKENAIHMYNTGLCKKRFGKDNACSKVVLQIKNGAVIAEFYSVMDAQRETGILGTSICRCCYGKYKHAGGFVWKYK